MSNKKQKTTAPLSFRRLVPKPFEQLVGQEYSVLGS
jgi:hypothetical protein